MPFLFTFLCRNSLSTKSTSSSFFVWVTNHTNCTSWKLPLLLVVMQYKLPWLPECFHPYGEIPSRKGKYPMLRTNTKPHQLIKHAKISYSIASLVFRKFSYRTYQNGLNQVPQSWGSSSISKSANCVSSIPFVGNPHFSILLHRVPYLKNLLCLEKQVIIFSGEFKIWN